MPALSSNSPGEEALSRSKVLVAMSLTKATSLSLP